MDREKGRDGDKERERDRERETEIQRESERGTERNRENKIERARFVRALIHMILMRVQRSSVGQWCVGSDVLKIKSLHWATTVAQQK